MDYFIPEIEDKEINKISVLGLAHLGDCVYELMVRTMLCTSGHLMAGDLHRSTVKIVNANAQADAVNKIYTLLDGEELAVYKRGRNTKVNSVPHNSDIANYHAATGLETLFGWLYLKKRHDRINELFAIIMEED